MILHPDPSPDLAQVDALLLDASGEDLSFLDVSRPDAAVLAGRMTLGNRLLISAQARDELAFWVGGLPRYEGSEIPAEVLPTPAYRLVLVDATDAAHPFERASAELPNGTGAVVRVGLDYAVLGGVYSDQPPCYPGTEEGLFIERYSEQSGELLLADRREYGTGGFELSSDGEHAVRVATDASGHVASEVELEVIDLRTLETSATLTIPAVLSDDGTVATTWEYPVRPTISADISGDRLVVTAGADLWAVALASHVMSAPLTLERNIERVRFLVPGEIAALAGGGNGLVRLEPEGSGVVPSLLPLPSAGTPSSRFVSPLVPFGDGLLLLGASGDEEPHLLAKRYALTDDGLSFVDEVEATWGARAGLLGGTVDAVNERVACGNPDAGSLGLLASVDGRLRASELTTRAHFEAGPLLSDGALFISTGYAVQALAVDASGAGPALHAAPEVATALPEYTTEHVDHAGLVFTTEDSDSGGPFLRYRTSELGPASEVELPHRPDVVFTLDASHVAVAGFEYARDAASPDEVAAGIKPNGVSVLRIDDGAVSVVTSLTLDEQALLPPAPEGVVQTFRWRGYFALGDGRFALLGTWSRSCDSDAACKAIGAIAYESEGGSIPSGNCTNDCEPVTYTTVGGSRIETVFVELDASDPEAPTLGALLSGGPELVIDRPKHYDYGPYFLKYSSDGAEHLAYTSSEQVVAEDGSGLLDSHEVAVVRNYLTLIDTSAGQAGFDVTVNIPGTPVAVLGRGFTRSGRGLGILTLEPGYHEDGSPYQALERVRIEGAGAYIEERVELGPFIYGTPLSPGVAGVLSVPKFQCQEHPDYAEDDVYEFRVADARGNRLVVSEPLVLRLPASDGFSHFYYPVQPDGTPTSAPEGQAYLYGGPAFNGRLVLDVTQNPPAVMRYETLE